MAEAKRILIAVDGSTQSLGATRYVARHWASIEPQVTLMHVMRAVPEVFWDLQRQAAFKQRLKERHHEWVAHTKQTAEEFLATAKKILTEASIPEKSVSVNLQQAQKGVARDLITESKNGYDAIVLGRRGLSALQVPFLGSVSTKVIERAHDVAVWLVGGYPQAPNVLLAVDSSEYAAGMVHYVGSFAAPSDARITLIHVTRALDPAFRELFSMHTQEVDAFMEQLGAETQAMFKRYREILLHHGIQDDRITTKHVTQAPSRAASILDEARSARYGTVVMGRRGLSKVYGFLTGRVTNKVLHQGDGLAVWICPANPGEYPL
ncbi:MAG TPA: universal stress protein [Syntrophobacteria bacterium]|nr:universal stress protein [Syntrophobacteria bacterium]